MENNVDDGIKKRGYKRAFDRVPGLEEKVGEFEKWFGVVNAWWAWVEENIPENTHSTRREVLEDFHFTSQGLELLERLHLDIHPDNRDVERVEYDVKKLLRAVVMFPTLARLSGVHLEGRKQTINTIFKQVVNRTLDGDPCAKIPKGNIEGYVG